VPLIFQHGGNADALLSSLFIALFLLRNEPESQSVIAIKTSNLLAAQHKVPDRSDNEGTV
jgi:hypothetical protein